MGRMLDWRYDAPMWDDWYDDVCLIVEARSRGAYRRDDLDRRPILDVMLLAEQMLLADRETAEAVAHVMAAMMTVR